MRIILCLLSLSILAACGFTPVYGTGGADSSVSQSLQTIAIETIPDREGQSLRNKLIDRMYKNGYPADPAYRLSVSAVEESIVEIGIDKNDNASRAQLRQNITFSLISNETNEIVLKRTVRATTGYNILLGQFTTFVTEGDARDQAIRILSENIVTQLEIYFSTHAS